jgi:hypothetical protein
MQIDLVTPIAVVCHDAGAANHVISWLRADGRADEVHALMRGPAERLWRQAFPHLQLCKDLAEVLQGARSLISGTGWASDLEHEARRQASAFGIESVAVVDHWVNFAERFVRAQERLWPDEFWVVDQYALAIAEKTFPGKRIRQMPNVYLANQLESIRPAPTQAPELLYVLEPVRCNWGRDRAGEFQALDYFVTKLPLLNLPPNTLIRLRPHPSEEAGKYQHWIASHPALSVAIDNSPQISEALSRARWVAGCESFALVIALQAGRDVYCVLPPWAPACRLPHDGLIHLNKIV